MLRDRATRLLPYLSIIGVCAALFALPLALTQPRREGDGSHYYAMYVAWRTTGSPFMTPASWAAYSALVDSGQITDLVPLKPLRQGFPQLSLGDTQDFPHFWFYSLLAAANSALAGFVGIAVPAQAAFIALHFLLLASLCIVAWRCFGWGALGAVAALIFLSPIVWYYDKVHTEWFTVCLTTAAVILFMQRQYALSALGFALASTQNVSFAAASAMVLAFQIVSRWRRTWPLHEAALFPLTLMLMVLSPIYYFFRFGAWTPYIVANLAGVGKQANLFWIYLLDPDVGLLPNWPFGIMAAAMAGYVLIRQGRRSIDYRWLVFVPIFVAVTGIAQSSNWDLNQGATPGPSRYALWYLCLFFPALLLVIRRLAASRGFVVVGAAAVGLGAVVSIAYYAPWVPGTYTTPTPVSHWLQAQHPAVYNPPPEIFAERFGGGISSVDMARAGTVVLGPDCRKLLVLDTAAAQQVLAGGQGCGMAAARLLKIVNRNLKNRIWKHSGSPTYFWLSDADLEQVRFLPRLGQWYDVTAGSNVSGSLASGWWPPEDWGTWTDGKRSNLRLLCPRDLKPGAAAPTVQFELVPFTTPNHPRVELKIVSGRAVIWSGSLSAMQIVEGALPSGACQPGEPASFSFIVESLASPADGGIVTNKTDLGVGLIRIRFAEGLK